MDTNEIRRMSRAERLQAIEALWDALLYEDAEIESPPWHGEVLEERQRKIAAGEGEFLSLAELKNGRDR